MTGYVTGPRGIAYHPYTGQNNVNIVSINAPGTYHPGNKEGSVAGDLPDS